MASQYFSWSAVKLMTDIERATAHGNMIAERNNQSRAAVVEAVIAAIDRTPRIQIAIKNLVTALVLESEKPVAWNTGNEDFRWLLGEIHDTVHLYDDPIETVA